MYSLLHTICKYCLLDTKTSKICFSLFTQLLVGRPEQIKTLLVCISLQYVVISRCFLFIICIILALFNHLDFSSLMIIWDRIIISTLALNHILFILNLVHATFLAINNINVLSILLSVHSSGLFFCKTLGCT